MVPSTLLYSIGYFALGIVLGLLQTGAQQNRTFAVYNGFPIQTLWLSILITITYWFSTHFIVQNNHIGFIGFSLGTVAVTTIMAYRSKLRKDEINEHK